PVFLILYSFLRKKIGRNIFLAGFAILISELFIYQLFPWHFGNLIAGNLIFAQTVEVFGVYGLSFLVFIVSFYLYTFSPFIFRLLHRKKTWLNFFKQHRLFTFSIPLMLLGFFLLGSGLFLYWEKQQPTKYVDVMMIQPDAPLEFRDGRSIEESMEILFKRIEKLAKKGGEGDTHPDLIVLPESAVPFFSAHNTKATNSFFPSYWYRFEALIFLLNQRFKANVYFNEIDSFFVNGKAEAKNHRSYNHSVLYDPNGERKNSYAKSYLLAFGEYIPLGETFEFLYSIIPQVGRFLPGDKQELISYYRPLTKRTSFSKSHINWIETKPMTMSYLKDYYRDNNVELKEEGKFLPLICYEVIIPEFVRKFAKAGAPDFIVNITNDKWYGRTVESYQHMDLARLRSIEFRRWMVRSTNSGTSTFVDHLGRIVDNKFTDILSSDVYRHKVGVLQSGSTFYMLFGNAISYIFLFVFTIYTLIKIFKKQDR
ncbi:MAG: apolipoprotein N-acyltransferase, partial [Leptospiraceae bacterium]|nr:apolipoprotein N-acyltransferase [Leptospiraceae bacterium]